MFRQCLFLFPCALNPANLAKHNATASSETKGAQSSTLGAPAGPNPFQSVEVPPLAVEVPKAPTTISVQESVLSAQKAHASSRQVAMQMVSCLKPAFQEVKARSEAGSAHSAQPVLKAPKKKEPQDPVPMEESAPSDVASDDMFLSVHASGKGIEDKFAAAAIAAAEATRKVMNKDFWEDMALWLCKVVGGYGALLEQRAEAREAPASRSMA